ncbi:uncharacterized protein LOC115996645 isoform X3 [Ipomoea triloba]|uniref:uncharacterized protein LOC115996645 isoform X3 n=1 Tax=Ipomoea triloba TaxID=35885 RepID=UPI00125D696F|nr:uncharacterized protein LOC115996645 isoform X3 [Ipomoea triloba]XP_031091853.1 uncharacterized protein LOC115996645 isoform X3 [Ipomoea triloba]XP_031091854.1 uncharacterized protein LOC115996645 isoform X3 [Ipomoea triloba]
MASAVFSLSSSSSCLRFHSKRGVFLSNPSSNPHFSRILSAKNTQFRNLKKNNSIRATSSEEGLPTELIEDSKFVPLNAEDPRYGPPALLLLGFELEDAVKIKQFLKEMDGEFLEIIFCTEDMISRSIWEAVNTKQRDLKALKIAKPLPRICFLSGLTGEEMMMFIDAFPESGLEQPVFAALVPNAADKPLEELIEEIMGDHETLSGTRQS